MSVTPRFEPACEAKSHYLWEDPPDEDKFSACVHCGMCLESCPTYLETGLEQHSPRGRVHLIKSVARGKMEIGEGFREPIDSCLDCRACETACPSGVQVGTLIEQARGQIFQALPRAAIGRGQIITSQLQIAAFLVLGQVMIADNGIQPREHTTARVQFASGVGDAGLEILPVENLLLILAQ